MERICRRSPVAQMVKHLPAMQETPVQSLGQEDSLKKEMQPTPAFLPRKSHGQRSLAGYTHGVTKSQTHGVTNTFRFVIFQVKENQAAALNGGGDRHDMKSHIPKLSNHRTLHCEYLEGLHPTS